MILRLAGGPRESLTENAPGAVLIGRSLCSSCACRSMAPSHRLAPSRRLVPAALLAIVTLALTASSATAQICNNVDPESGGLLLSAFTAGSAKVCLSNVSSHGIKMYHNLDGSIWCAARICVVVVFLKTARASRRILRGSIRRGLGALAGS